ncbi:Octanoyltransferase [Budvicia aquatica]|nr:Octanoyltransferase [Budvicia aquatica]
MDLEPFNRINPCGYAGLQMTQMKQLVETSTIDNVQPILIQEFTQLLGYQQPETGYWNLNDYE